MRVKEEKHIHPTHLTLQIHSVSTAFTHQQPTVSHSSQFIVLHTHKTLKLLKHGAIVYVYRVYTSGLLLSRLIRQA